MNGRIVRRRFLQNTVAAGLACSLSGRHAPARAANRKINIACVGVGGKGASDLNETSVGHNIVAICDIDEQRLAAAAEKFPTAKKYTDWRRLLEQQDIDAVTVSTPDHMHAAISLSAIELGKHVFTQKPLTHSVVEARRLTEAAKRQNVLTQMGIQHHASARLKTAVQVVQDQTIGRVREVHAWTDRPGKFWKQGLDRPEQGTKPPSHVHWDQWLGVAPERPYVEGLYHPFHWRGWWDFGTGALGDMGCHILDPIVNALKLGPPKQVWADGPEPHPESGPLWCVVHYQFPGTALTDETLKLTWYEAGRKPPHELFQAPDDWQMSANAVLFVGEKGNLVVGFPETAELFPKSTFADYVLPVQEDHNHYLEWTNAIADGRETSCPYAYSGPLTETVLLGNVAFRSGHKIEWDSQNLKAIGNPEADRFLRREYRPGWLALS